MKRVAVFVGTRPEGIKLAPVVQELERSASLRPLVVSTGQHEELLDQVVTLFGLAIDHDLRVMSPDQTLAELTARLLSGVDGLLERTAPELALVQGDTTTVLAAALACFYRGIPVGHVEAGLRTGDFRSPFPEEANRCLASQLVDLHFTPTESARSNLLREGVQPDRIFVTGNTVIDALHMEVARQGDQAVKLELDRELKRHLGPAWGDRPFVLVTGHRRESFGPGFRRICRAIAEAAREFPSHDFVYPVHLNPNVRAPVLELLQKVHNVALIPPQPYAEFVALMCACEFLLTDSGGIQEEAPALGKPALVMRDTSERPEGIAAGNARLVGTDEQTILREVRRLLTDREHYRAMATSANPYGDGKASKRIVRAIEEFLAGGQVPTAAIGAPERQSP